MADSVTFCLINAEGAEFAEGLEQTLSELSAFSAPCIVGSAFFN